MPNNTPIPSGAHGMGDDDAGGLRPWFAGTAVGAGTASPTTVGGLTVDQLGSGEKASGCGVGPTTKRPGTLRTPTR